MRKYLMTIVLAALFVFLSAGSVLAAIDAYVIEDQGEVYKYLMPDLIESFNTDEIIWNDFYNRMLSYGVLAVYDSGRNRYVSFSALVNAFNDGVNVMEYTEKSEATIVAAPKGIKVAGKENNTISYKQWMSPHISDALFQINTLSKKSDMQMALVDYAEELKLNLSDFNALNTYAKDWVANEVITKRPNSGYGSIDALKSVFDSEVTSAGALLRAALNAVNNASSPDSMNKELTDNAVFLMLDMDRFNSMHVFAKDLLVREMLAGRTYGSAESVSIAFANASDKTEATIKVKFTHYNYTISQMVDEQMTRNPQTDLLDGRWRTADPNLVSWHVNPLNFNETNIPAVRPISNVNMREGPADGFPVITTLHAGSGPYFVLNEARVENDKTWYRVMNNVRTGWVHGDFVIEVDRKGDGIFQFLLLSETAGIPADEINQHILTGKGSLEGMAEAFIEGARQHNINEVFLISLALHETGQGTSVLASGLEWDGPDGKKIVYNMFGIRAVDSDPINKGAEHAYNQGWFTPEAAIIGGAQFTAQNYIHHATYKQDTLYKMRWNPARPGSHQYATDIGWAAKQVKRIKELYELCNTYVLRFDIPIYVK